MIKKVIIFALLCFILGLSSPEAIAQRVILTAPADFYVNGDPSNPHPCGQGSTLTCAPGVDSTNCTTPATACLTLTQATQNAIFHTDVAGYLVTIHLANTASGNYSLACDWGPTLGNATFGVTGDCSNPTAATIIAQSGTVGIFAKDLCIPSVQCLNIVDGGSASGAVNVGQLGVIDLRSVTISGTWNSTSALINAEDGGKINMLGVANGASITNTIDSTSIGQAFDAQHNGIIHFNNQTIAIPHAMTIAAGQSFVESYGGLYAAMPSPLFTGAGVAGTTGSRCFIFGGYLDGVNPNSVFPGNSNCSLSEIYP